MSEIQEEAFKIVGHEFLLSSPQQVAKILFQELGIRLPPSALSTMNINGLTTNEEVLSCIRSPIAEIILEFRKYLRLLTTYIDSISRKAKRRGNEYRVHSTWLLTDIATGRIQSIEPNLQNVPKGDISCIMPETHEKYTINVRDAFIAREGYKLISADYREMELRLLAHECGDPKLLEFFRDSSHDNLSNNNTSPTDFFKYLASHWLSKPMEFVDDHERQHVKTITYGAIYGIGKRFSYDLLLVALFSLLKRCKGTR